MSLFDTKIVDAENYDDDTNDILWVYIRASMIDYYVDENTGEVVDGDNDNSIGYIEY